MTRLRTLGVPGCGGSKTDFTRALEAPSISFMAMESSSTALVLCPTADPSPLWMSLDSGWEGEVLQSKRPGLVLQGDMDQYTLDIVEDTFWCVKQTHRQATG